MTCCNGQNNIHSISIFYSVLLFHRRCITAHLLFIFGTLLTLRFLLILGPCQAKGIRYLLGQVNCCEGFGKFDPRQ
jgi:hypothetical protein